VEVKFRVEQRYVAVLHGAAVAHLDGLKAGQKTGQGGPDRISADGALTGARDENRVMLVKCDQGVQVMSVESVREPAVDVFRVEFRHRRISFVRLRRDRALSTRSLVKMRSTLPVSSLTRTSRTSSDIGLLRRPAWRL
jgi:hypothetical protein